MMSGTSPASVSGISVIVLKFFVISSPKAPSPRVAPSCNFPFSYLRDAERPSIFGSATMSTGSSSPRPKNRLTRASNSCTSSSPKALPNDNMGREWATFLKLDDTLAPMRSLGLSARFRCGNRISISSFCRLRES